MNLIKNLINQIRKQNNDFGINQTLNFAESQPEYDQFMKIIETGLTKQLTDFANNEDLVRQTLTLIQKAQEAQNIKNFLKLNWKSIVDYIRSSIFVGFMTWAGNIGGQSALDKLAITAKPFELENEEVTQYFNERTNLLVNLLDDTTQGQLASLFIQGRELALTPAEMSELIFDNIPNISKTRADMIARNELANAVNVIEYETFKRNNVKQKRWVTALDDRVCPFCEPLHNTIISLDNKFNSSVENKSGKTTTYSVTYPPLHVNCRCYLEEVFDGTEVINENIVWTGK